MRTRTYFSDLDVDACQSAIRGAARMEFFWIDNTWLDTAVFRPRAGGVDLRFKRATSRVVIHNWFALTFSEAGRGGTEIAVKEHVGVGPSWWVAGLVAGVFVGVFMVLFGKFTPRTILVPTAFMQGMLFLLSGIVAATARNGDRERLSSFLERVARSREAA